MNCKIYADLKSHYKYFHFVGGIGDVAHVLTFLRKIAIEFFQVLFS